MLWLIVRGVNFAGNNRSAAQCLPPPRRQNNRFNPQTRYRFHRTQPANKYQAGDYSESAQVCRLEQTLDGYCRWLSTWKVFAALRDQPYLNHDVCVIQNERIAVVVLLDKRAAPGLGTALSLSGPGHALAQSLRQTFSSFCFSLRKLNDCESSPHIAPRM